MKKRPKKLEGRSSVFLKMVEASFVFRFGRNDFHVSSFRANAIEAMADPVDGVHMTFSLQNSLCFFRKAGRGCDLRPPHRRSCHSRNRLKRFIIGRFDDGGAATLQNGGSMENQQRLMIGIDAHKARFEEDEIALVMGPSLRRRRQLG